MRIARRSRSLALALTLTLAACGDDPAAGPADAPSGDAEADIQEEVGGKADAQPDEGPDAADDATEPDPLASNFGVEETEGDAACEGLDATHCLFPYPSDRFRVVDAAGARLAFGTALPRTTGGEPMDPEPFRASDGFSPVTPILFSLPGVSTASLPSSQALLDPSPSLDATSPTVLLDAETGERVAHAVELDHFSVAMGVPVVVLRPARPLAFSRRYVVAVRGLPDAEGDPLPAHPGFAALRHRTASHVRGVHARRARFEAEVFPVLDAAGLARADLQLAFDFTTRSEAGTTSLLVAMRDAMITAVGDAGPQVEILSVETLEDPHIARLVKGVFHVPSFLDAPDAAGVRRIRRDAAGAPVHDGTETVPFELQIPHSALASPGEAAVLQYGHGLFYSKQEARKDWLRQMAERERFLILGLDMQGMHEGDMPVWAEVLALDLGRFPHLAEAVLQGLVNHLAAMRAMKGRFAELTHEGVTGPAGERLYDPTRLWYYGNSQGGTLGAVMASVALDTPRAVLGVPGAAFSLLLNRSTGFAEFSGLLQLNYDGLDFVALFGPMQTGLDLIEPLNYARDLFATPLPGTPANRVLLQVAKEDSVVDNQVSFLLGRAVGARLLTPAVRPVWGLETVASPVDADTSGAVLTEFDFGHPDNPDPTAPAPVEHDTHEDLRRLRAAQDQLVHFLETGAVVHLCDGVCDPD